ncbi:unnamed protein product [Prunus armeniaca]
MPSFMHFKEDSNPESHLKQFKSAMIFYKTNDALMCKVFAMTLLGAATTRGGIFASSIYQSASQARQPRRSTSSSRRGSQPSPPKSRGTPT